MAGRRQKRIALTGSIGMGKSTTARLFAEEGVPVWDADAAVHRLYAPDAAGAAAIAAIVPEAVGPVGVDRTLLRDRIRTDPSLLPMIEAVIHPLVAADRNDFLEATDSPEVLLDIPLLFETGSAADYDTVVVVSAPAEVQRARVLERPGMTDEALDTILARQMPDDEKRKRADYVIDTSRGVEDARGQVRTILRKIRES